MKMSYVCRARQPTTVMGDERERQLPAFVYYNTCVPRHANVIRLFRLVAVEIFV